MKQRITYLGLVLLLLFAMVACGSTEDLLGEDPQGEQACTEMANLTTYYGLSDSQVLLITDSIVSEQKGLVQDGVTYLPMEEVQRWDKRLYWNEQEEQLIITNAETILYFWPDLPRHQEQEEMVEDSVCQVISKDGIFYVSYDLAKSYCNVITEEYAKPGRIVTFTDGALVQKATVQSQEEAQMRTGASIRDTIVANLTVGDYVYYGNGVSSGGFTQVVTADGHFGYVKDNVISTFGEELAEGALQEPEYVHMQYEGTIQMVWHQVFAEQGGSDLKKAVKGTDGITVISPTWFAVTDTQGNISSLANKSYVDAAHDAGMKVWALVNDFTPGVPGIEVLSNTESRRTLIDSLISEVTRVGADGINVDFEYITVESGPHYIQFLRELYLECRAYNLVLSTDVYVPTAANAFYDLKSQKDVVDYVIIMAYDEHHGGSTEAGSVASLPFVENGVTAALKKVPANQLILGVPFFTRRWTTEIVDGVATVSSEAGGMSTMKSFITKKGGEFSWDETCKQYYGEVTVDDVLYQVWLEDTESLRYKLDVMQNNSLAGMSGWKLGLESDDVWEVLTEYTK